MAAPRSDLTFMHVALTVSDLERSIEWYTALFDAPPVHVGPMLAGTPHEYSCAVWRYPNLGLHHFADGDRTPTSERRPGLDHVAFRCESLEEVEAWRDHASALGLDHGEILDEPYGRGLAVRDPDNIQLEFFAPLRPA